MNARERWRVPPTAGSLQRSPAELSPDPYGWHRQAAAAGAGGYWCRDEKGAASRARRARRLNSAVCQRCLAALRRLARAAALTGSWSPGWFRWERKALPALSLGAGGIGLASLQRSTETSEQSTTRGASG